MNTRAKPIVLLVDEASDNLIYMNGLLQEQYEVKLANTGAAAVRLAQQLPRPDLILLDVDVPDPDGYTVCQQLKSNPDTAAIPIIFLLESGQDAHEVRGICEGGADVLHKPLVAETFLARVDTHIQLRGARELLKQQRNHLEHLVEEVTLELQQMLDAMIWAMASLAERRESETVNHLRRIQHYVAALARQLRGHPRFEGEFSEGNIKWLFKAAPLHDIGKVAIPDAILLKPDRLTPEEFEIVKLHTVYGHQAIVNVERHLGYSNTFLRYAREITHSHQEKYDGSGYPQGLAGDQIPVSARLVAVADVYDALVNRRVYKPAFTHETAMEMLRQSSGEHLDPDMVDAMLMVEEEFRAIAEQYSDDNDPALAEAG
ncbi:HD-GYP domain-containing protein [Oxalobacteraceae bacterium A2-2]